MKLLVNKSLKIIFLICAYIVLIIIKFYPFQVILFGVFLILTSGVSSQILWTDPSSGITVKTLYVPLQKGSSSISLQNLNLGQTLTNLKLPYFPVNLNTDLQQASTQNQNYQPKLKIYQSDVQPLQDVRAKINLSHKVDSQVQNSNGFHQVSNLRPQQYNIRVPQITGNSISYNSNIPQQIFQHQYPSNHVMIQPQNANHQSNYSNVSYQNNPMQNGNIAVHPSTNKITPTTNNQMNHGQRVYFSNNALVQKFPGSSTLHTNVQNIQNQAQTLQHTNNPNSGNLLNPSNTVSTFQGESSRYFQQLPQERNVAQTGTYGAHSTERPTHMTAHHQNNYGIQNAPVNQHLESSSQNNNHQQTSPSQENIRQNQAFPSQQSPQHVNTYAVVHQRIPNNNFIGQDNRANFQSEQQPFTNIKQSSETIQTSYINNAEYGKSTVHQNQQTNHGQVQNQINVEAPQNSLENVQYSTNQVVAGNFDNHQYNNQQGNIQMQVPSSQFSQETSQQDSSEDQYYNQQQTSGINYNQQQSSGDDYTQQQSPVVGYNPQQSSGSDYNQPQSSGIRYNQQQSSGSDYNQQQSPPNGISYNNHQSSENDYGQQQASGMNYNQQQNSGISYNQQHSSDISAVQNHNPNNVVIQQNSAQISYEANNRPAYQQNSAQVSYPDPASETFYPENGPVYVAPPPTYASQIQDQQTVNTQGFIRYASNGDHNVQNSQIPISSQTNQIGVQIALPNRNHGTSVSNYGNVYK